jgi:hypothetical protein
VGYGVSKPPHGEPSAGYRSSRTWPSRTTCTAPSSLCRSVPSTSPPMPPHELHAVARYGDSGEGDQQRMRFLPGVLRSGASPDPSHPPNVGRPSSPQMASRRTSVSRPGASDRPMRATVWRCRDEGLDLVVDRSTTGLNSDGLGGRSVDGMPAQRAGLDASDKLKHLAKVRVAGSNPVFRSIAAARGPFFNRAGLEDSVRLRLDHVRSSLV